MALLALGGSKSAVSVEGLLEQINESESPRDLRFQTRLQAREFGGMAAFAQACATWTSKFPTAGLRTYADSADLGRQLANFVSTDHGVVSTLLVSKVLDNQSSDVSWEAGRLALGRLADLQTVESGRRGSKVMIVAADDTSFATPPALYSSTESGGGSVRTEAGFTVLAKEFLGLAASRWVGRRLLSQADAIGSLLYELVRNSHEYGRSTADGALIRRSVRFVRAEGVAESRESMRRHAKSDPKLLRFLERTFPESSSPRYLELTVWDSGPGLTARRLRDLGIEHPTFDEERLAAVDCFAKHLTTSRNTSRGIGLDRVQNALSALRGLLRVRTGRLLLERDYCERPHQPGSAPAFDEPTELAPARGTSVTLLIPTGVDW